MNRKIQETDRLFIVAAYTRDPHAFNAARAARSYGVSIRTIYNLLSKAGIKMRRGRKSSKAPDLGPVIDMPKPKPRTTLISLPPSVTNFPNMAYPSAERLFPGFNGPPKSPITPRPTRFTGVDDETFAQIEEARAATRLTPPNPYRPMESTNPPKPELSSKRGPPAIRPEKPPF